MSTRNFHPRGDRHYSRRNPDLVKRGAAANGAKLSDDDRAAIRRLATEPGANKAQIGRAFGVSRQTVWRVRKEA